MVFDNAAGPAHSVVMLTTTVYPSSITVTSSNNYSFSGSGSIGGVTAVTVNGPGNVTLATSNSYAGGTNLNGGVLNDGAANSFGGGLLTVSGGTLNANNAQLVSSVALSGGLLNLASSAATIGNGGTHGYRRHARQYQRFTSYSFCQQPAELERQLHLPGQQPTKLRDGTSGRQ